MSRNAFEGNDDPQEELDLFEKDQRGLADNEVDDVVRSMSDADIEAAVGVQFHGAKSDAQTAHIAKLKQEGLYATARFFERALAARRRTT